MSGWANDSEAFEFLKSRSRFGIKPGLERMHALLAELNHPEQGLRFIHVAGTNGKGSTCAFLSALYLAAGLKTGQYTSPDLGKIEDRVTVHGKPVTSSELAEALFEVHLAMGKLSGNDALEPTEFEVLTAAALLVFRNRGVEVVVWETGLGGRYDATNVVQTEVSIITNVGLDHQEILGDTVAEIALDKAGIIKSGVPVVTAAQGDAIKVISQVANQVGSRVYKYQKDFNAIKEVQLGFNAQRFDYRGIFRDGAGLQISLLGDHQLINAACALAGFELSMRSVFNSHQISNPFSGIKHAYWPGRLEMMKYENIHMILDGAHNHHAAKALVSSLRAMNQTGLFMVLGMMADKDIPAILEELLPVAQKVWLTRPDIARAAHPEDLRKKIQDLVGDSIEVIVQPHVFEAVKSALEEAKGNHQCIESVLITGSLYTVSEARKYILSRIERERKSDSHANEQ